MFSKEINNEHHVAIGVPRKFISGNLKEMGLDPTFLIVYCSIDRWHMYDGCSSYYKSSVLNICEDVGKHYPINCKKPFPKIASQIENSLRYMENTGMITLQKGKFENYDEQFVVKINPDNFYSDDYIAIDIRHLDFILNSKSTIKKENILLVLLYCLSKYTYMVSFDKTTGETKYVFHQVYSESNKKTSEKIGLSDKTIASVLKVLAGSKDSEKPLIVHSGLYYSIDGMPRSYPDIYTENSLGWEDRIRAELDYYKNRQKESKDMGVVIND